MAITVYEHPESRELVNDREGQTSTVRKYVVQTDDIQLDSGDINDAVANVAPDFDKRLFKQRIRSTPKGGGFWMVDVEYQRVRGFDHPEGGGYQNIQLIDPLGMEFAFDTSGATQHITKSEETVGSYGALFYGPVPDTGKAIGVSKAGVAGCDIPIGKLEITITRKLRVLRMSYIHALVDCTGCTNDRLWNTFDKGRALFLGATGTPIESTGLIKTWSVSYRFLIGRNLTDIKIGGDGSRRITVASKLAHDYLWVGYVDNIDTVAGVAMQIPAFAKVERVHEERDFALFLQF